MIGVYAGTYIREVREATNLLEQLDPEAVLIKQQN